MDRIALIIGNSNYQNVNKLKNPKHDADDIEKVLQKLNFDVTKITDATLLEIQQAVNNFLQALDEYAVGLLFYAGHGMQIDGRNYIAPIDLECSSKSRTTVSCYCLNTFLDGIHQKVLLLLILLVPIVARLMDNIAMAYIRKY